MTLDTLNLSSMKSIILFLLFFFCFTCLIAQNDKIDLKIFGHLQYNLNDIDNTNSSYFSLGEQDFFITSTFTDRISFLGETVVKYDNSTSSKFAPSIERAQLKYDYYKNHSLIIGKIHTPVNYWNDVYHHGRLFFPVIERPLSFSYYIPVHTLGARLQGQNLGDLNFGYDLMVGNGISMSDIGGQTTDLSYLASVYIQPWDDSRFGISYFNNKMTENGAGVHSGHSSAISNYEGSVDFKLFCMSAAYFGEKIEFLSELTHNRTNTDSLGVSTNYSGFAYLGWRINGNNKTPYILFDYLNISDKELHSIPTLIQKMGVGYKYDISHKVNVKFQLERILKGEDHFFHDAPGKHQYNFQIQFSYGL